MSDKYLLDENGNPVPCDDMLKFANDFKAANRHIGDTIEGNVRISTVFLGSNHRFGPGPPLLYETMIFGGTRDAYQERYSTRAEAETGHARICREVFGIDYEESAPQ